MICYEKRNRKTKKDDCSADLRNVRLRFFVQRRLADDVRRYHVSWGNLLADRGHGANSRVEKLASMLVAFPAVILYGISLFSAEEFIKTEKRKKIYHYLTIFGFTPWLCLHLLYAMILYAFAWLNGNGFEEAALPAAEALLSHFLKPEL